MKKCECSDLMLTLVDRRKEKGGVMTLFAKFWVISTQPSLATCSTLHKFILLVWSTLDKLLLKLRLQTHVCCGPVKLKGLNGAVCRMLTCWHNGCECVLVGTLTCLNLMMLSTSVVCMQWALLCNMIRVENHRA